MVNQKRINWTNRYFIRLLAVGALVVTLFGTGWAAGAAGIFSTTPGQVAVAFGTIALMAIALIIGSAGLMRLAQRLPVDTSPQGVARSRAIGKRLGIGFGIVFGSEALLIAVASSLLGALNHDGFILPVIVLIVGLHFLPLAWLFQVWPYYVSGTLLCLVAMVTLLAIPQTAMLSQTALWDLVPATGSALVLWLTALVVLLLGRRTVLAAEQKVD
jgi:hypothetical protein